MDKNISPIVIKSSVYHVSLLVCEYRKQRFRLFQMDTHTNVLDRHQTTDHRRTKQETTNGFCSIVCSLAVHCAIKYLIYIRYAPGHGQVGHESVNRRWWVKLDQFADRWCERTRLFSVADNDNRYGYNRSLTDGCDLLCATEEAWKIELQSNRSWGRTESNLGSERLNAFS